MGVVRYFLIFLGLVTVALGVVLAHEGEWWIAVPDAVFGLGVAWVAAASLRADRHPGLVALPLPEAAPAEAAPAAAPPKFSPGRVPAPAQTRQQRRRK